MMLFSSLSQQCCKQIQSVIKFSADWSLHPPSHRRWCASLRRVKLGPRFQWRFWTVTQWLRSKTNCWMLFTKESHSRRDPKLMTWTWVTADITVIWPYVSKQPRSVPDRYNKLVWFLWIQLWFPVDGTNKFRRNSLWAPLDRHSTN